MEETHSAQREIHSRFETNNKLDNRPTPQVRRDVIWLPLNKDKI